MTTLRKVLVVDDDPVVGKSFDRVLSGKGYAVITAGDGEEAMRKLAAEDYDVVYTDIKMPGMNGLEVAERVKAHRPWTPVVIITGYGTPEHEARAKAAGVTTFLHKPLSPEMIEDSAREALDATVGMDVIALPAEPLAAPEAPRAESALKNIGLFAVAPFVALGYVIAFPFIGFALLAWFALRAAVKTGLARRIGRIARNLGLFAVAPFVALAYVVLFPFVGLGMLAWFGARALFEVNAGE